MRLTREQRDAVQHIDHAAITACPGSGKTRTIIAKMLACIDVLSETPRKVACITYTNTAVHEIESRIRRNGGAANEGSYEVSTIHAFCQSNILGKYHWMTEAYKDGYTILPSDHDSFTRIVETIGERYDLSAYARSQFELLGRRPDGTPLSGAIPPEAALAFWDELQTEGFIDFCNIVYYSYRLVRDNPSIAHNLSCRFAYMLVDEFQDTSALQVKLLGLINEIGHTLFFLVGDPEQSIYSFAGAERELMPAFSKAIGAIKFPLSGNFRATQPLVGHAERLIPRRPPMVSVSTKPTFSQSVFYERKRDSFAAMVDCFLPFLEANRINYGNAAVLAPNWFVLRPLGRQLREYGIPVVGPGARPYRRKYFLGRIAEQVCAYLESRHSEILYRLEKELFMISSELTGSPPFRVFSYQGMRIVQRLMHKGESLTQVHDGAADWLHFAALAFEEILVEEGIIPISYTGCLSASRDEMLAEMQAQRIDVADISLADLGVLANPRNNLKLMTMHGAKGREFEAVAIICAHDGLVPFHNQFSPLTISRLNEARRIFYVAMTRAERALWIFSSPNTRGLPPTRFIGEIGLH